MTKLLFGRSRMMQRDPVADEKTHVYSVHCSVRMPPPGAYQLYSCRLSEYNIQTRIASV